MYTVELSFSQVVITRAAIDKQIAWMRKEQRLCGRQAKRNPDMIEVGAYWSRQIAELESVLRSLENAR